MSYKNKQLSQLSPVFMLDTPLAADSVSSYVTQLTTGDVNNDGYPDIAAAHGFRTAGLYINHGDGSFAAEQVFSETWWDVAKNIGATSIALSDLNGDGNLDMVIPIYGNHYSGHMVQLYQGVGDGTFELWPVDGYNAPADFEGVNKDGVDEGIIVAQGAANPMFPLIDDFNGDGLPDVVVSGNNGSHSVDVLTQSAHQEFSVSDSEQAGQNPQFMSVGDFNEDGYPDVVAGALYNGVLVFLNNADGKGTLHQEGNTYLSPNHQYVVTADFDGDGHQDIAARGNKDALVSILYGDGTGHFPSTHTFAVSGQDGYLAAADIDNDGDSDLVIASSSTKSIDLLLNDGTGQFGSPESIVLDAAPWGITTADFDQNGFVDIAVSRADNTIQTLWNKGGVFVTPTNFNVAENKLEDSAIGTIKASGSTPLNYVITAGNSDPDGDSKAAFSIDADTGKITVNDSGDLNYEVTPQFNLQVKVTDTDGLSDTATVTVNLVSVDEAGNEPPVAENASFTLAENSINTTAVGIVTATDVDAGDTLSYAITAGNTDPNGNSKAAFAIDPNTGKIIVNDSGDLDFETTTTFNLTIKATDTGGLSDTAIMKINLNNVNELPVATDDSGTDYQTDENKTFKTANVLSNDNDPDGNPLSISSINTTGTLGIVINNNNGTFNYNPNGKFDYLKNSEHATDHFTYVVSDGHGEIDTATVTIDITGINTPPSISQLLNVSFETGNLSDWTVVNNGSGKGETNSVVSGGTDGNYMAKLHMPSQNINYGKTVYTDTLRSSTFTALANTTVSFDWQVTENGDDSYAHAQLINAATGTLAYTFFNKTYSSSTNFTTASHLIPSSGSYYLEFQGGAYDASQGGYIGADFFIDNIKGVNSLIFSIAENSSVGTVLTTVPATDLDVGDTLTYTITAGNSDLDNDSNPAFAIDASTGVITVNDSGDLDFEKTSQLNLQVKVIDAGGLSDTTTVTANLANVDELGNDRPEAKNVDFTLPENSMNATAVGIVTATDVDAGDTLSYVITAGNTDPNGNSKAAFAIDSTTGKIIVNDSGDLDFETTPTFNLTVTATDAGGLSDTATIIINLSNMFELNGTAGNDSLSGTTGNDVLNGLAGNDTLSSGEGDDMLIGGADIDRITESANVNFTLTDTQLTGVGTDTLSSIERATLTGGSGNNVLDASGFNRGSVILDGDAGNDTLIGPSMAGTFHWLNTYYNIFIGGDGNDTLTGGIGIDCIKEIGNVDFILTQNQLTGRGTDQFSSMEFAYLIGGFDDNRLDVSKFTGSQTVLEGGTGNDTLVGGAAVDWVRVQGNLNFTLTDNQVTGLGTDTLINIDSAELLGDNGDNQFDASDFTGNLVIMEGGNGNDTLIGRTAGIDWVRASGDVDFTLTDNQLTGQGIDILISIEQAELIGGVGNNTFDVSTFTGSLTILEGDAGDDTLIGRSNGIDQVRARGNTDFTLTDTQLTGLGTDTLTDIDQAVLIGDGDDNTLNASVFTLGSVFLWGESGNDTLKGGAGNDVLIGGVGDDTLNGGAGIDRIKAQGDTDFTLTDTQLTGLGTDTLNSVETAYLIGGSDDNTLDASSFTGSLVILEGQAGNDALIGRVIGIDEVCVQADVNFILTDSQLTGLGTDTLVNIDQAKLVGNSGDNVFDASVFTLGLVNLLGGGGDDTLLGGSAGDSLNGGQGDDSLLGGLGNDRLTGGLGADIFKFNVIEETGITTTLRDVIKDFEVSQGDKIDLSGIDADTAIAGNQAFAGLTEGGTFSGSFANPSELYFDQSAHILYGNNNADSTADFSIQLIGVNSLSVAALML